MLSAKTWRPEIVAIPRRWPIIRMRGRSERVASARRRSQSRPPRSTIGEGAYHAATPCDRAHSAWCAPNIPTDGKRRSSSSRRASTLRRYACSRRRTIGATRIGPPRHRLVAAADRAAQPGRIAHQPDHRHRQLRRGRDAFGRVDERRVDPGLVRRGAEERRLRDRREEEVVGGVDQALEAAGRAAAPASGSARPRSRSRSSSRMRSSTRGSASAPITAKARHPVAGVEQRARRTTRR